MRQDDKQKKLQAAMSPVRLAFDGLPIDHEFPPIGEAAPLVLYGQTMHPPPIIISAALDVLPHGKGLHSEAMAAAFMAECGQIASAPFTSAAPVKRAYAEVDGSKVDVLSWSDEEPHSNIAKSAAAAAVVRPKPHKAAPVNPNPKVGAVKHAAAPPAVVLPKPHQAAAIKSKNKAKSPEGSDATDCESSNSTGGSASEGEMGEGDGAEGEMGEGDGDAISNKSTKKHTMPRISADERTHVSVWVEKPRADGKMCNGRWIRNGGAKGSTMTATSGEVKTSGAYDSLASYVNRRCGYSSIYKVNRYWTREVCKKRWTALYVL